MNEPKNKYHKSVQDSLMKILKNNQARDLMIEYINKSPRLYAIGHVDKPNFYWVSGSWIKRTGYTFDELTSNSFLDFVHPDDVADTIKAFDYLSQHHDTGFEELYPNRYKIKSGGWLKLGWDKVIKVDNGELFAMEANILTDAEYEIAKARVKTFWDDSFGKR